MPVTTQQAERAAIERSPSPYHGLRMSEAEYLALPEEKPYLEYVDGVVLQKPMPNWDHTLLAGELIIEFGAYQRVHGGATGPEFRARLPRVGNHRLPDVSFWAADRPKGDSSLPTLVVEIRSPGQTMNELRAKCRSFIAAGVDACWIIDPVSRTAEVFEGDDVRPIGPGGTLESAAMPGFSLPLADLFARIGQQ